MEPIIAKLDAELKDIIEWRYCMGGLIPAWNNFSDDINSVSRPFQMGPVWMHAAKLGSVPIDHNIWFRDPPASSFPACIAVKSAGLQLQKYGDLCLHLLRRAAMTEGINISKKEELIKIGWQLKQTFPLFDIAAFKSALTNGNGLEAFKKDMQEIRANRINRFPTMILRQEDRPSVLITGYRPYEEFIKIIHTNFINYERANTSKQG